MYIVNYYWTWKFAQLAKVKDFSCWSHPCFKFVSTDCCTHFACLTQVRVQLTLNVQCQHKTKYENTNVQILLKDTVWVVKGIPQISCIFSIIFWTIIFCWFDFEEAVEMPVIKCDRFWHYLFPSDSSPLKKDSWTQTWCDAWIWQLAFTTHSMWILSLNTTQWCAPWSITFDFPDMDYLQCWISIGIWTDILFACTSWHKIIKLVIDSV